MVRLRDEASIATGHHGATALEGVANTVLERRILAPDRVGMRSTEDDPGYLAVGRPGGVAIDGNEGTAHADASGRPGRQAPRREGRYAGRERFEGL